MMTIARDAFGKTRNEMPVFLYTLRNEKTKMMVKISTLGAVIQSLQVPDKNGRVEDIALGYDRAEQYCGNSPGFGALIGRHANRIGKARFSLNGKDYSLLKNDGENNLHSGSDGFQHGLWKETGLWKESDAAAEDGCSVSLSYFSKDGEQGFPGNLTVRVTYKLQEDNGLLISYDYSADADTVVNLTNHCYFNLAGQASGTVLNQRVWINGDRFTPADRESIPTGEIRDVAGTPMDFTVSKLIGRDIDSDYEQLVYGKGFDHNWVLNKTGNGGMELAARMEDELSGRCMEVYTDLPGMQFYTGNFLCGTEIGKGGTPYAKHAGACFETQYFPDAMNKPAFAKPILRAGEACSHFTLYKFL